MTKYTHKYSLFTYILLFILLTPPRTVQAAPLSPSMPPVHGMIKDILRHKGAALGEDYFLTSDDFLTNVGDSIHNGYALAISRLGSERGYDSYLSLLYNDVSTTYIKNEDARLEDAYDWLTTYLTILSLGGDPANITNTMTGERINLLANYTYHYTSPKSLYQQGTETMAYALLAMDSLDYIISENSNYTRKDLINALINSQQIDGSFSSHEEKNASDSSLTALVLVALAPFYNDDAIYPCKGLHSNDSRTVRSAIKQGIAFLSSQQTPDGDIMNGDQATLKSTALTLQACTSIGIDPHTDERFLCGKKTLFDGLSRYQLADGGFCCTRDTDAEGISDDASNIHALNALISYYRLLHSQRSFYDMREEQSKETKELIADLESALESTTNLMDRNKLLTLYQNYCSLSVADRRYVFHYEILEQAMKKQHLPIKKQHFLKEMGKVSLGNGYLYNIINNCELTVSKSFSHSDYERYLDLPGTLTLKDYPTLTTLYCKLANTDPTRFHPTKECSLTLEQLLIDMKKKKTGLETIQAKIDQINRQVTEKLPPLSQATDQEKELIDQLLYQANCLTTEDRVLIPAYDELIATQKRLAPKSLFTSFIEVLVLLFLLLCSPVLLFKPKTKD